MCGSPSTLIVLLLLVLVGCERSPAPGAGMADSTAGTTADADGDAGEEMLPMLPCVNRIDGYTVSFPRSWHVNADSVGHPCSFFDPEPLQIPVASEVPLEIGVIIGVDRVEFATASGEVMGRRNIARETMTVDGRPAARIEGKTTGEGLYDRGIGMYQYLVDLEGRTLIATTYDAGTPAFERKRRVLDAMMRTLSFRDREQPSASPH